LSCYPLYVNFDIFKDWFAINPYTSLVVIITLLLSVATKLFIKNPFRVIVFISWLCASNSFLNN
jgi:hypothetical protein